MSLSGRPAGGGRRIPRQRWMGAAAAQRVAFAAWLAWGVLAALAPLSRDAA
jgi:hypothetical protein